jgi:branched-chain amino acid transport system substrate-binding protein
MTRILIAAPPADARTAASLRDALAGYFDAVHVIGEDAAPGATTMVDVLLVVIGAGAEIEKGESGEFQRAVEAGLSDSDLLVLTVMIDETALPPVTELPPGLRALPYMNTATIRTGDSFGDDVNRLVRQITGYLRAVEAKAAAAQVAPPAVSPRYHAPRRLPWNLIILSSVLLLTLVLIFAPRLRGLPSTGVFPAEPTATLVPDDEAAPERDENVILLGLAAGLSGSPAVRGEELLNGAELALTERPFVMIEGVEYPVDLVTQDARCSAAGGAQAAELFAADPGIVAVIGHMCDASCSTAAPVYEAAGYTAVSPGCAMPRLTTQGYQGFNRTVPSLAFGARAAAEFLYNERDNPPVMVIADEDFTGRQLAQAFAADYAALGGDLIERIEVEAQTLDLDALAAQVLAIEPELVYFAGRVTTAAQLVEMLEGIPLLLANAGDMDEFIAGAGQAAEGSMAARLLPPEGETVADFSARYAAAYGSEPATGLAVYAYDAANLLLDGIEAVGTTGEDGLPVIDRERLREAVRAADREGVTGRLRCAPAGDCGIAPVEILVVIGGELRVYDGDESGGE